MSATVESKPETHGVIAKLGNYELPLELDRLHLFGSTGAGAISFCFAFRDVPFSCTAERQDGRPVLALVGDFGALPYSAESPERRRSVQTVLAAAQRRSGLEWKVTPTQTIAVKGGITLDLPLTPKALVVGTVAVLLRARPYIDLLVEILSLQPAARQPGGSVTT